MKKTYVLLAALLIALTSCADSADNGADTAAGESSVLESGMTVIEEGGSASFDYLANDLTGYVKVADYKGLTVTRESAVVTDEEFESELEYLLDSYATYEEFTDRNVEEGDTVRADYKGIRDGVAFEGGTATNTTLTAASDTGYIPGFAEAFIGQTPGKEFEFNVTFPENYGNADLAGVEVTFVCTVHAILGNELIYPELTDEFVSANFGYSNAEEFRIAYRASVEENKKNAVENNMYSALWQQIVEASEILGYPESEVTRIYNEQRAMYEQYAVNFGIDYDTFLASYLGVNDEDLYEECRGYVKEDLVIYQLVKDLAVEITAEEYTAGVTMFAESYGMTNNELIEAYGESTIMTTLYWQEVMDIVASEANIVEE